MVQMYQILARNKQVLLHHESHIVENADIITAELLKYEESTFKRNFSFETIKFLIDKIC